MDTRIRSLETARECVRLGARQRTIAWLTGLPTSFIFHNVYDAAHLPPRGRPPYAEDFVFRSPLRVQAEIGVFAAKYRLLTAEGFAPAQALLTAFKHYRTVIRPASCSFDEAFFVVSNLDGIWAAPERTLELGTCRRCGCLHVVPHGAVVASCPCCRSHRYDSRSTPQSTDADGTVAFPDAGEKPASIPVALEDQIRTLRAERSLQKLGAHPRVVAALTNSSSLAERKSSRPTRGVLPRVGRPINLGRWGEAIKTVQRAQFSLVVTTYSRLIAVGLEPSDAIRSAFSHVSSQFPAAAPLSFDRCFELVALFDARWGAGESPFDLLPCRKCQARYLVSRRDREQPRCPFCALIRTPEKFL